MKTIQTADVNISVEFLTNKLTFHSKTPRFTEELGEYFNLTSETPDTKIKVELGFPAYHNYWPELENNTLKLPIINNYLELLTFTAAVGYLAGQHSREYRFSHSSGIIYRDKGILIVGNSGSGKTRISSLLEEKIIDDDILLVSKNEMRSITKKGYETQGNLRIETDNNQGNVDGVLVLNKNKTTKHHKILTGIPKLSSYEHSLDQELLKHYKQVETNSPIIEIGTYGNDKELLEKVNTILEKYIN